MSGWSERTPSVVAARYDRLAPIYGVFEWLYALPLVGVRRRAVEALELASGDRVLELGCGDGRNFDRIVARIGPSGALYGVDVSPGMLARAETRVRLSGWSNVHLARADATTFSPPVPLQAALFSFSYSTMRDRLAVLAHAWSLLVTGGRLVIVDARLCEGWPRRLFSRLARWSSALTLLGRPDTDPRRDLARLAGHADATSVGFGLGFEYVICAARKA